VQLPFAGNSKIDMALILFLGKEKKKKKKSGANLKIDVYSKI
jgi:hypothetical protein